MSATGTVELLGLRTRGRHGVLAAERALGQDFAADVVLHVDVAAAAARDDLAAAVDYSRVAADVHAVLAGEPVDLLETLATRVADACLRHRGVRAVEVAVHKPQAPLEGPFADVVVRTTRTAAPGPLDAAPEGEVPVLLALGANLGDRAAVLRSAVAALAAQPGLAGVEPSPVVESAAVTPPGADGDQPDYLNAVVRARTALSPQELLRACQRVEAAHGRDRSREGRWGPRTLDVDLVRYGDLLAGDARGAGDPVLQLPHPRAAERAFVLVPWALLAPDDVLPGAGRVGDLAARLAAAPHGAGVRRRPDLDLTWPAGRSAP
jgi:dihydroneopterin aldolase/2-amino-4-hydroxy-6-hydroxymethyldihydropteridine diphosphokinase